MIQSDDELAIVLAHELAHVVTGHAAELINQDRLDASILLPFQPLFALGLTIKASFAMEGIDPELWGIGNLFFLPIVIIFARRRERERMHEREADYIGLIFAAEAGYDINAALGLFTELGRRENIVREEMTRKHGRDYVLRNDWLSTHPTVGDSNYASK